MGKFIDINFLPTSRNDPSSQAMSNKLRSMASTAQAEKCGYEGVITRRPLEQQQVVKVPDGDSLLEGLSSVFLCS